jgi:hypothetical protein
MCSYRLTRLDQIGNYILPIFDQYPLLTSKQLNYERFKAAYYILINPKLLPLEKNSKLNELKLSYLDNSYISPIFNVPMKDLNNTQYIEDNKNSLIDK